MFQLNIFHKTYACLKDAKFELATERVKFKQNIMLLFLRFIFKWHNEEFILKKDLEEQNNILMTFQLHKKQYLWT